MAYRVETPSGADLVGVGEILGSWQGDPWPGHLHPGDLGWKSMAGAEQTAASIRVWTRDGTPAAIGLADGDVLRLAVNPPDAGDPGLAHAIRDDLVAVQSFAALEARGAPALTELLYAEGWTDDEPWTPLRLDLPPNADAARGLRIEPAGPDDAGEWLEVHWSAFRGTALEPDGRARLAARWRAMTTGPYAALGQHLIGYDADEVAVAVTSVWSAGRGRPGLIEPMGVRREHGGRGHGVAITLAGARALQQVGASAAVVVAENSNAAAVATYRRAGFTALDPVHDLRPPG